MVARHVFFLLHLRFSKIIMGFLSETGENTLFFVVTIFPRFFPLCRGYESILRPEYIYFVYHNCMIMDQIMIPESMLLTEVSWCIHDGLNEFHQS
jgi:hypothetical protein